MCPSEQTATSNCSVDRDDTANTVTTLNSAPDGYPDEMADDLISDVKRELESGGNWPYEVGEHRFAGNPFAEKWPDPRLFAGNDLTDAETSGLADESGDGSGGGFTMSGNRLPL